MGKRNPVQARLHIDDGISRLACIEELLVALVSVCLEDAVLVEVHPDGGTVVLAGHAEFKPACAGRDEGTGYQVLEAVVPGDFRHGSAERGVVMEVDALVFGAVGELAGAHRVPGQEAAVVVEVQEGVVARVLQVALVEEEAGEVVEVAEGLGLTGSFVHGGSTRIHKLCSNF